MHIDPERGAQVLFDRTFKGTLPVLSSWEEQPEAFKDEFRQTAEAVASAALVFDTPSA